MASSLLENKQAEPDAEARPSDGGGEMGFLEHLDELRRRLIRSVLFIFVAVCGCWFVSDYIYDFLARPVRVALAEAQRRQLPLGGITGQEQALPLSSLKADDTGRYIFSEATRLGQSVIPPGASVQARVVVDGEGRPGLFTDEPLYTGQTVIPKGVRLPLELNAPADALAGADDRLVVSTAMEPFSLYAKVSIYTAIALSIPFLLWQIWAFVAPGLYPHERGYVVPFIALSSIAFVVGASFAYYVIFPPAATYLLGLGQDFRLLLKADDYFDFIIFIMMGMGVVFQMPAVTYVLARLGIVTAGFLVGAWKTALIVILIAAALLSPTSDILNMMLFAAPMVVLYLLSILIAWIFNQPRRTEAKG
ncbi:MAG: twin-arginine translocase subunit TatC [Pyrinomonadaceae bacterium]